MKIKISRDELSLFSAIGKYICNADINKLSDILLG